MSIDTVGDFLTTIRNAVKVSKRSVTVPFSRMKFEIARALHEEGYIREYSKVEENGRSFLQVLLKYVDGEAAIHQIVRVSTPGRRCYRPAALLDPILGGLGIAILTTNKGVVTDREARKLAVGGEVLCQVW